MNRSKGLSVCAMALASAAIFVLPGAAFAQESVSAPPQQAVGDEPGTSADIVVTARKRDEKLIEVPVAITAVAAEEIERRGISNLDGLARAVPQLLIGPQSGATQGGNVVLRGVSGPDANALGDQSVSFNIDGVQIAKSSVRRMGETDVAQVEVLKGPQALFYGKNSPGGVISIRTGDPTAQLEGKASLGYEFGGREIRGEGYISGPISDAVGFRIAAYFSDLNGYLIDQTPKTSVYARKNERNVVSRDATLRGTLTFNPSNDFSATLKVSYGKIQSDGAANAVEYISCPIGGVRQTGSAAQCGAGRYNVNAGTGAFMAASFPSENNLFRADGEPWQKQQQVLAGLNMRYDLTSQLSLNSITGYYWVDNTGCVNNEADYTFVLPSCPIYNNKQYSQEVRLSSDFGGIIDFVAGAYVASNDEYAANFSAFARPGMAMTQLLNYVTAQKGSAWSVFGQLIFKPFPTLEVDVGGRYSRERKRLTDVRNSGFGGNPNLSLPTAVFSPRTTRLNYDDFSPEVTIAYRPTGELTVYGSYKEGFLSGGFNTAGGTAHGAELGYGQQLIEGYETGVKALIADRQLALNLAAYSYTIDGLQLSNFVNATNQVRNAGSARVRGIEGDFAYDVRGTGFRVNGSAAYNNARYTTFANAPCYNGQRPVQGCTPSAAGNTQTLSGKVLARAPEWSLSAGAGYEGAVSETLNFGASFNIAHTTSFFTDISNDPAGAMPAYTLVDANVRVFQGPKGWELALIGRNLTDQHYYVATANAPFTGSGTGTAAGVLGDRFGAVSRGREVMLRATLRY